MFRKYTPIYILTLIFSLFFIESVFASYTPGATISLTGSTMDVRFDVAEPLFGTAYSGAYLDTNTKNMSGAFYIQDIGWALMSSGSYQVRLDCGSQSLTNLTIQCQFTSSGWSENIGELGFQNVRYNPSTATLSGSITSFAGNFSVEGIYMPLIRAELSESLSGIKANHNLSYSIKNPERYVADNTWSLQVVPSKNPAYYQTVSGGGLGYFGGVDLSLADTYTFRITDPDGGVTEYVGVVVSPADASTSLDTTAGLFVGGFCNNNPSLCPDGSIRTATTLSTLDTIPQIADGVDAYNYTLRIRDRYGNRITTGSVEVSYTGTVSAVQIPDQVIASPYSSFAGLMDAVVIDNDINPIWKANGLGSWKWNYLSIPTGSIAYTIGAIAPTDGVDNRVLLDEIVYTAIDGAELRITDSTELTFVHAYSTTITGPMNIVVGEISEFAGVFTSDTTQPLNPEIIILTHIGSGVLAYYDNLVSYPAGVEVSRDANWMIDVSYPSSLTIIAPPASFSFSGRYVMESLPPVSELVQYYSFVHYVTGALDVFYPVGYDTLMSEKKIFPVKFLGQDVFSKEQNSAKIRTDVFNKIRKNTALLSRNRDISDDYSDVRYTIYSGDISIDNSDFDNKETIITVGGDITIVDDIDTRIDHPLAIIALSDNDGNGGDIIVHEDVTDISSSLFAERTLVSTGSNQLYIYGSLISANTLGGAELGICPYFVQTCSDPTIYDLSRLRAYTGSTSGNGSVSASASTYSTTSLIIDYDMRLQIDPPVGFPQ